MYYISESKHGTEVAKAFHDALNGDLKHVVGEYVALSDTTNNAPFIFNHGIKYVLDREKELAYIPAQTVENPVFAAKDFNAEILQKIYEKTINGHKFYVAQLYGTLSDTIITTTDDALIIEGSFVGEFDILTSDDLFFNNISWQSFDTEWTYLVQYDRVYMVNGYGFNAFNDLIKFGRAEFKYAGPLSEYEEEQ